MIKRDRHVTHLLARYASGQLGPAQQARVVNHVRTCPACRAALAREERVAAELRREMPAFGQPGVAQMARVWAGVWADMDPASRSGGHNRPLWLPGVSALLAMLIIAMVALPLILGRETSVEAALVQPSPNVPVTAGISLADSTREVPSQAARVANYAPTMVAGLPGIGIIPAPVPQATASPLPGS